MVYYIPQIIYNGGDSHGVKGLLPVVYEKKNDCLQRKSTTGEMISTLLSTMKIASDS